ncbi:hypothetical protein [Streptomyces sp. NPDC048309]
MRATPMYGAGDAAAAGGRAATFLPLLKRRARHWLAVPLRTVW